MSYLEWWVNGIISIGVNTASIFKKIDTVVQSYLDRIKAEQKEREYKGARNDAKYFKLIHIQNYWSTSTHYQRRDIPLTEEELDIMFNIKQTK